VLTWWRLLLGGPRSWKLPVGFCPWYSIVDGPRCVGIGSFSTVGMVEGQQGLASFVGGFDKSFLNGITMQSVNGTIPEALWALFQMTFAIITPALMVGSFVERMKFNAVMWCVA
jgi:hypothetical protein